MSSGPADCAAEGELYRAVWREVYTIREILLGRRGCGRFPDFLVQCLNKVIAGEHGYQFRRAQYAEPVEGAVPEGERCVALWDAAFRLREALVELDWGHRGWSPVLDPEMEYLLVGTGYVLTRDG